VSGAEVEFGHIVGGLLGGWGVDIDCGCRWGHRTWGLVDQMAACAYHEAA